MQNIYDNPEFFKGYQTLRSTSMGFNDEIEQPALRALVGDVAGKTLLDVGCGFGDFCRYAAQQGAEHIVGIDPSERMLALANEKTVESNVQYQCVPVEKATFAEDTFDVIVSSVALHYVAGYGAVMAKMASWLKPGGLLVFSVEHPVCTANPYVKTGEDAEGVFFPVRQYRDAKQFHQSWFVDGVEKYHRTVSDYMQGVLQNALRIVDFREPMPTDEQIAHRPDFAVHTIRPPLLMIAASK